MGINYRERREGERVYTICACVSMKKKGRNKRELDARCARSRGLLVGEREETML